MNWRNRPLYVLGAGFTRAFLPGAPLLRDNYNLATLLQKFPAEHFPRAHQILVQATRPNELVDFERLMTRLQGGMPYDGAQGATDELNLLLRDVKLLFGNRLNRAREDGSPDSDALRVFARHCLDVEANIITFNYDDLMDETLYVNAHNVEPDHEWHPNGSYGFFCRPATEVVGDVGALPDRGATTLLKLHGSVNWRVRAGYAPPYSIDSFVHAQPWCREPDESFYETNLKDTHIEMEPFIVPPILNKADVMHEPILKLLWTRAYDALQNASSVTFVGYSMPFTDVAAASLFSEAIRDVSRVRIVDRRGSDLRAQQGLKDSYRAVFDGISGERFSFFGAVEWASSLE